MFKIEDFIKLLKYFKDNDQQDIDKNLIVLAEDTKAKTTTLFNENIDLPAFSSDDYKRLKEFLISWYSSLKTLTSVQKLASDVRSLPEEHLNTLITSFGYDIQLDKLPKQNKADFFYDLVNLYKIKGTPEAIERVLSYFGIPDIDLVEYWLEYDENGKLVFRPEKINKTVIGQSTIESQDVKFSSITSIDPHWFLTENQVNQLFLNNKIAFPSKSPYFGIQPVSELSGSLINSVMSILVRMIQDQYQYYISGSELTENISTLNSAVSLLNLYLGVIYVFNYLYPKTKDSSDSLILCYNGSMSLSNQEIIDLYEDITSRGNSKTRDEIKVNQELYVNNFTRLKSTSFLTSLNSAGNILQSSDPDLKYIIDSQLESNNAEYVLQVLLQDLSSWIINNISSSTPSLLNTVLGFSSTEYIREIVNFFKPYRSRLILIDNIYKINNPLHDSVIEDDLMYEEHVDKTIDFDTGDSEPSYPEGFSQDFIYYVKSEPPIGSNHRIFNMYVDSTGTTRVTYETLDTTAIQTTYVYSDPPVGCHRVYNIFLEYDLAPILHVVYEEDEALEEAGATPVESIPPNSYYFQILNVYLNGLIQFSMDYSEFTPIVWPIDSTSRIYYSRLRYDCNSYFDIGASTDNPPLTISLELEENIYDIYNYHTFDSTTYVHTNIIGDSTSEMHYAMQMGGFVNFDGCGVFDAPPISDACFVYVIDS